MDGELNRIVGNNIKTLRIMAKMTQTQVANILKIATATLSLYERGARSVPLEHLVTLSRLYNFSTDALLSFASTIDGVDENVVYFQHFMTGSTTIYASGESKISNPYSVYFTLEDTNGDTLIFLRTDYVTDGIVLVSENETDGAALEFVDISKLKNRRLYLSTITINEQLDGKEPIYTYTNHLGDNLVMRSKTMFIYFGVLIARINHIGRTEEFFATVNS